ncbi:plasmid replication protein RepC (plasmid) [Agrobacterium tumefaciens]|uniref:plasmid replication protein RepC n=1 Tax=Agrobacterium tumefaciens TaxID=358 RepID=UPI001571B869|nr:plasmid replication protein RepC [Agrobacterium tumefaciens]NSZ87616.1 replication initiation protein RepC [Agrobacterium tumefaciens]WCA72941.1 plasmid replication protein RepC [Agrobacterium tumefaciens]
MQTGNVTTPFGRRPMTLALVKRQIAVTEIKSGKSADKWMIFRDVKEARETFRLPPYSIAVLDALLTFYPEKELRQDAQMIVFPSNAQLMVRANGMSGATLRRHLAILVDAGMIVRKDSPNGKRYARKDGAGEIERAFGFDLSPLLARAEEFALAAQEVATNRREFLKAKESLTLCRRDVRKVISAAIEEGAEGDWEAIEGVYLDIVRRIPRTPSSSDLAQILDEMQILYNEVINRLDVMDNFENISTNGAHRERHIQNSKPESNNELEPSSEKEQDEKPRETRQPKSEPIKAFPIGMVLKACPQIGDYGPGGQIASWRDLMSAAVVVRSMLGVSPSAYQTACETMGPENAAAAMACILERAGQINSAGGYLRDLTRRAEKGEFSLGPMLMALMRGNAGYGQKAG